MTVTTTTFKYHPIVDGSGNTLGWIFVGPHRTYTATFLESGFGRVRLEHPDAIFTQGESLAWGSARHLQLKQQVR